MKNTIILITSIAIFAAFPFLKADPAQYTNRSEHQSDQMVFDRFLEKRSFVKIWNDCLNWTETYKGSDFMICIEDGWNGEFVPNVVSRLKSRALLRKSHMKDYMGRIGSVQSESKTESRKSPAQRSDEFKDIMWGITRIDSLNALIKADDKILDRAVKFYMGRMHESTVPTYKKAKRECMASLNFMNCMDASFNDSTDKLSQSVLEGAVAVISARALNRLNGMILTKKSK